MNLSGIISISGKPGLYKVVAQSKNSIIVESLIDNRRVPAYATDRISALEDISIYTVESDKPLVDIFADIYAKQEGKEAPSHKEDISILREYFEEILPDYDDERVYPSDIKKLFQWYNMLLKSGNLTPEEPAKEEETEKAEKPAQKAKADLEEKKETKKKPAAKKKPADKKESK